MTNADLPFMRIGELAALLGEPTYVLRFWEAEFGIKPQRSKRGQRVYTPRHVADFIAIRKLLREWKFTIEGARAQLKRGKHAEATTD